MTIKIKTQKQLDKAIAAGERDFEIVSKGEFEISFESERLKFSVALALKWDVLLRLQKSSSVEAWGSSRVEARGSSRVEARGSSSVVAWESSSVVARGSSRVEARGSSSVVAWESSSVVAWESSRVEAWESSRVEARGSSRVEARGFVSLHLWNLAKATLSAKCHVHIHSKKSKATGGIQTEALIESPKDWCDYYGVEVKKGIAVVYKALNENFSSAHDNNFYYTPGTTPKANGWDKEECSNGLHFCAHPRMAKDFHSSAKKFVACPVKVKDMLIFMDGRFPQKCKAPTLAAPCWEVDENGEKI